MLKTYTYRGSLLDRSYWMPYSQSYVKASSLRVATPRAAGALIRRASPRSRLMGLSLHVEVQRDG